MERFHKQRHPQGPQLLHQKSSEIPPLPHNILILNSTIALPALWKREGCLRSCCLSSVTDNGLKYNIKPCIPVCLTNDVGHIALHLPKSQKIIPTTSGRCSTSLCLELTAQVDIKGERGFFELKLRPFFSSILWNLGLVWFIVTFHTRPLSKAFIKLQYAPHLFPHASIALAP